MEYNSLTDWNVGIGNPDNSTGMDEHLLDDALLMQTVTEGDAELLAIDLWLHDSLHPTQPTESEVGWFFSTEHPQ